MESSIHRPMAFVVRFTPQVKSKLCYVQQQTNEKQQIYKSNTAIQTAMLNLSSKCIWGPKRTKLDFSSLYLVHRCPHWPIQSKGEVAGNLWWRMERLKCEGTRLQHDKHTRNKSVCGMISVSYLLIMGISAVKSKEVHRCPFPEMIHKWKYILYV